MLRMVGSERSFQKRIPPRPWMLLRSYSIALSDAEQPRASREEIADAADRVRAAVEGGDAPDESDTAEQE